LSASSSSSVANSERGSRNSVAKQVNIGLGMSNYTTVFFIIEQNFYSFILFFSDLPPTGRSTASSSSRSSKKN